MLPTAPGYRRANAKRLAAVLLLLCACSRPKPESPGQLFTRALATYRNGHYDDARRQTRLGSVRCGAGAECQWKFRLLEAEILFQQGKDADAAALLAPSLPGDARFAALEIRRRMLLGYLLTYSNDNVKAQSGRDLLDGAYSQAAKLALLDLLAEIEILKGKVLRSSDPGGARALFLKARQNAAQQGDRYNEAAALTNLGMLLVRAQRYDEAIPYFEQALPLSKAIDARQAVATDYINLGTCYTQLGNYDQALQFEKESLAWLGTGDSPVVRRNLLGEMGRALEFKGQSQEAISYYRQAYAAATSMKDAPEQWIAVNNLASALAGLQDWDAAERINREEQALAHDNQSRAYASLNAATIAAGRNHRDEAVTLYQQALSLAGGDAAVRWESNAGLARLYAAAGNKPLARAYFSKTVEVIDKNQTGLSRYDYQMTFLAALIHFYQDYVEFLMQNGDSQKALEIVESSRARILAETVAQSKPAPVTSAAELRRAAQRSGRVFVSYWLAPVQSYVWVISPGRIDTFTLGPSATIESLVESFRQAVREWDLVAGESSAARRLSEALIRPVAAATPRGAHIVIVPDGALHYVNFETLPVYTGPPHYWIEDVTLAVAPSLAIAAAAPAPKAGPHESALIIGDALAAGPAYARLVYASTEIAKVGSHFVAARSRTLVQAEATPAAYREANPQQFSVIHFSAHGEPNAQFPLDSAIVLSPKDGAFKLYAREIMVTPLRADLVTISACRSAGARVYSGEGLVGLAWAFLKAGARYVVAGLWDVTDSSTPEMMDQFYAAMQAGQSPVDALRAAKLTMIHSARAIRKPYYWGPFQIYIR